jgi:hypothetical protein
MTDDKVLPERLRAIPPPWNINWEPQRSEGMETLAQNEEQIRTALDVLENCFIAEKELPSVSEELPEGIRDRWGTVTMLLAKCMPTLQDITRTKVQQCIEQMLGLSISGEAIAIRWLRETIPWIRRSILHWLEDVLPFGLIEEKRDRVAQNRLLSLAEHYWRDLGDNEKMGLVSTVSFLTWRDALPFLETIEQDPNSSELVRNEARKYHQWIVNP